MQAFQRLNRPIFADSPCDTLDQLAPVGLRPVRLTLHLLEIHRIHRDFFTHFAMPPLQDLQNRTMVLENHHTTMRA
jgi:hypothetical protein